MVMTYVRVEERLRRQEGIVSTWQLLLDGLSRGAAAHLVAGMREVHDGVFASGHAPLTDRQLWWAATCTAPRSTLSHASAGAAHGFRTMPQHFQVVMRPGNGGPRRHGKLLICYSTRLVAEDIVLIDGLPVTSGARTVLDLVPGLGDWRARRMVREALRVGATTADELRAVCDRHRGRRGVARLRLYAEEYAPLPARRTKSDPELAALELLQAFGRPLPQVNIDIAGEEADLSWPSERLIIELDGPAFHRFPSEDARKDAVWRAAGWTVRRLPTDVVYDEPGRLLALAPTAQRTS